MTQQCNAITCKASILYSYVWCLMCKAGYIHDHALFVINIIWINPVNFHQDMICTCIDVLSELLKTVVKSLLIYGKILNCQLGLQ
jgi:hypothetical protein